MTGIDGRPHAVCLNWDCVLVGLASISGRARISTGFLVGLGKSRGAYLAVKILVGRGGLDLRAVFVGRLVQSGEVES